MGAGLGLLMGSFGMDSVTGIARFTFGTHNLDAGINMICQMLGMFALCQVIRDYAKGQGKMPEINTSNIRGFGLSFKEIFENIGVIIRSFFLGLWIGFLPGMGSGISNMVAYGHAKASSKNPEEYGKGCAGGIWASETSNNASIGGALIPMMALGIPGDGITAMLLSGLTIHGLQAGPLLISEHGDIAYLIFACVLVSAIMTFLNSDCDKTVVPGDFKNPISLSVQRNSDHLLHRCLWNQQQYVQCLYDDGSLFCKHLFKHSRNSVKPGCFSLYLKQELRSLFP